MEAKQVAALLGSSGLYPTVASVWADLGCGSGTFTKALASKLLPASTIYAMDRDAASMVGLEDIYHQTDIQKRIGNFVDDDFPFGDLDGILMANSLHYVQDKPAFIRKAKKHLVDSGCFLIVEYDTDAAVPTWVPFPCSFISLKKVFTKEGFSSVERIHDVASRFGGRMYSAMVRRG